MSSWHLECSACGHQEAAGARATVCPECGQPYLVRFDSTPPPRTAVTQRWDMWRYAKVMPLADGEQPVSLGEGLTPMHDAPQLAKELGVRRLWIKDEGLNPTGSFKARGMSTAVTRARALGVPGFVVPTAGNAGAALAAYGAAARLPVRVYAPAATPRPILDTICVFGAELQLVQGHIGDAGTQARAFAAESGYFDVSTLREPYRIEGKKTMGFELADQLGWRLPDVIVYPTGGGVGLIGMWKAFDELRAIGWLDQKRPRFVAVQAEGCAPIVRAFVEGGNESEPWPDPRTFAAGIRVPKALGDFIVLKALRESGGIAIAVSEGEIAESMRAAGGTEGMLVCPEGGAAIAGAGKLRRDGWIREDEEVVVFNTGTGLKYAEFLHGDAARHLAANALPDE